MRAAGITMFVLGNSAVRVLSRYILILALSALQLAFYSCYTFSAFSPRLNGRIVKYSQSLSDSVCVVCAVVQFVLLIYCVYTAHYYVYAAHYQMHTCSVSL